MQTRFRRALALLLILTAAISPAIAQTPAPPVTGYFRGTILRINDSGIFAQSAQRADVIASSTARVGGGGPIYDPSAGQKFTTAGIPPTIFITGHPQQLQLAERDKLAAQIRYTGVTRYTDQYGAVRTIHTYAVTALDPENGKPQKPAPTYQNPLDKKPRR